MSTEPDVDPSRVRDREGFGRELNRLREHAGLTVRELAARIGIPSATAGGYLSARHLPSTRSGVLAEILAACGVSDGTLLEQWSQALARARAASDGRVNRRSKT